MNTCTAGLRVRSFSEIIAIGTFRPMSMGRPLIGWPCTPWHYTDVGMQDT